MGRNILDSLGHRREFFQLIALNSIAKEPSLFEYDKVFLSPSLVGKPMEFEEFLKKVLLDENPDLVIPCRDEDVAFLSLLKTNPGYSTYSFLHIIYISL